MFTKIREEIPIVEDKRMIASPQNALRRRKKGYNIGVEPRNVIKVFYVRGNTISFEKLRPNKLLCLKEG